MDGQSGPGPTIKYIALSQLLESPTNPRKTLGDLTGLTQSIQAQGFRAEHPLLVRPSPDHDDCYELISGHRRLAAAKLAGLEEIPCIVDDDLSTGQILQIQIIENAQRADVHPLEEAEAFKRLRDEHSLPLSMIAQRIGKSESHVSRRLALTRLCDAGATAYAAGEITLEIAVELARLPTAVMQLEAYSEIVRPRNEWEKDRSPRRVIEQVRDRYFLRLSAASWPLDDATVLPAAGSCAACPKRTGSQAALFSDVESPDTCMDSVCFDAKTKAAADRRVSEWKDKGATLVTPTSAKGKHLFYPSSGTGRAALNSPEYIELIDLCDEGGIEEDATWQKLIGAHLTAAEITVAVDVNGYAHELVETGRANELLKEHHAGVRAEAERLTEKARKVVEDLASPKAKAAISKVESNAAKWEAESAENLRIDTEVMSRAFALAQSGEKELRDVRLLRAIAEQLGGSIAAPAVSLIAQRFKPKSKSEGRAALFDAIRDGDLIGLRALVTTLVVATVMDSLGDWDDSTSEIDGASVLTFLNINVAAIAADVKAGRPAPVAKKTKAPKVAAVGRVKPGPKAGVKTGPKATKTKTTKKGGRK